MTAIDDTAQQKRHTHWLSVAVFAAVIPAVFCRAASSVAVYGLIKQLLPLTVFLFTVLMFIRWSCPQAQWRFISIAVNIGSEEVGFTDVMANLWPFWFACSSTCIRSSTFDRYCIRSVSVLCWLLVCWFVLSTSVHESVCDLCASLIFYLTAYSCKVTNHEPPAENYLTQIVSVFLRFLPGSEGIIYSCPDPLWDADLPWLLKGSAWLRIRKMPTQ